jgi:putative NADPH-quinone reductase
MSEEKKILVILANPDTKFDKRAGVISDLCYTFCDTCLQNNQSIDFIDLYKERFDPVSYPDEKDSQALEYQIRIRKADYIVIFHPVWWGTMPAILKGFCDKVFQSGFAYNFQGGFTHGLLKNKKAIIVAVSKSPKWQVNIVYSNILNVMWKRAIFDVCGIKSKFFLFSNLRRVSDGQIEAWHKKITGLAISLSK